MTPASLWTVGDHLRATVFMLVGVVLAAVGWFKASGLPDLDSQLAWAELGVVGLMVAGWAQVTWFQRGRRALARRRAELLGELDRDGADRDEGMAPPSDGVFVASAELRRYHRPDCLLAAGRRWPAASRFEHERAGRRPCGVCRPTGESVPSARGTAR